MDFTENQNVDHPAHYNQAGIECIDALKAATINKPPFEAVCVANAIKYLWRYEDKNGLEDVRKAEWYINRLIKELEDKSMKYKLVGTENGIGFESPWHTLIVPKQGDMFNPRDEAREHLLASLFKRGGYCPCQPESADSICPCKNYRTEGKCICGLFTKIPQTVVSDSVKNEVIGDESDTTKGTEQ